MLRELTNPVGKRLASLGALQQGSSTSFYAMLLSLIGVMSPQLASIAPS
jgi:hypothetical protein